MEDDPDSVLRWSERKLAGHLLECITRNPTLATYVKQVWLSLDSGTIAQDPLLPELIRRLPVLSSLQIGAYDPSYRWGQVASDLQAAIIDACQLPTLRHLHLNSVSEIPISLVTNSNLMKLELYNVPSFYDFERLFQPNAGGRFTEDKALKSGYFTSIRALACGYLVTKPKDCLRSIIESSAMATSLRTLRIMVVIDPESTDTPSAVEGFTPPFNLSRLSNLRLLKIRCELGPLSESATLSIIPSFLSLVNQTLTTVDKSAPLEEIRLTIAHISHGPLLTQLSSDRWKRVCDSIASLSPQKTQIKIKIFPYSDEIEREIFPKILELLKDIPGIVPVLKASDGTQWDS
ncbi:hypothetical protein EST38_g7983 [Candolleomyces aberdarensis]|uniref:F-box domain-containing protein n=1 Tax=Candolleomyces aberdarensis TaxID=2316362 RepID=A0A4Q2DFZ3_9AGAR|nr:hypothetical protein EST38_g7983 [Candolleomyces aberdarensis]